MIPTPKPGVNNPPRSKSQSKSKQTIITQPYIGCVKPGMTCTHDIRVMLSNGTHHHRPRGWGTYGGKQGTLITKSRRGPEHLQILNFGLQVAG